MSRCTHLGLCSWLWIWLSAVVLGQTPEAPTPAKPGEPAQQESKAEKSLAARLAEKLVRVPDWITLSAEQNQKLAVLRKECGRMLLALVAAVDSTITPEQKQAAATARKEALAADKEPAEVERLTQAALRLTAQQIAAREKVSAQQAALRTEVINKLRQLLTPEQLAELEQRQTPAANEDKR
mgnify:CR=1 FL=1